MTVEMGRAPSLHIKNHNSIKMKLKITVLIGLLCLCLGVSAQVSKATQEKRDARKNMVVKEWNKPVGAQMPFLDHVTTYDDKGRKIEEIEYTQYAQKYRITYEYGENGRISREVEYNDRNKVYKIRKYEYNDDGTKKKQYNYNPNGKLETVKTFEYTSK